MAARAAPRGTRGAMSATAEFTTASAEETIDCGRELARLLVPPKFLILRGELGAGKTTLVKGIAEGLNAADAEEVTSPTFTLIHEYEGLLDEKPVKLYHLDLYRLKNNDEAVEAGVEDVLFSGEICLVEWPERAPGIFPDKTVNVFLELIDPATRKLIVTS